MGWYVPIIAALGRQIYVNLKPACSLQWVSGQLGIHRKPCLETNNNNKKGGREIYFRFTSRDRKTKKAKEVTMGHDWSWKFRDPMSYLLWHGSKVTLAKILTQRRRKTACITTVILYACIYIHVYAYVYVYVCIFTKIPSSSVLI